MKNNLLKLVRYSFALAVALCAFTAHSQNLLLGEKYVYSDFSGAPLADTLWTASGTNGGSAVENGDTLNLVLDGVPSYNVFYTFDFYNAVDLSENANLEIRYKGDISGCESCALFFILEDENGNQTGDHWKIQEGIPADFNTYTKNMSDADVPQENVDFSKIKKFHIRSQSHDGSWGNAPISGTISVDYLKLGTTPVAKRTAASFEESFIGASLSNDLYDINLVRGAHTATINNGTLKVEYTDTPGWEPFLEIKLKDSINLTNNATMEVRMKVNWDCPENAAECRVQVRLADVNGNTTNDVWWAFLTSSQVGYQVLNVNWLEQAGDADLTQIDKIVFRSGTRDANWGGLNMSGSTEIDYVKVGEEATGPVAVPKAAEAKYINTPIVIDATIDEAWAITKQYSVTNHIEGLATGAPTPEDISAVFHTGWDNDFFYLFAIVKDDKEGSTSGSDLHTYDNVEIFLNPDKSTDDLFGAYGDDAMQIRFNRNYNDFSGQNTPEASDMEFKTAETDTGWVVEAKIKWAAIMPEGMTLSENLEMGFELSVADRDDADGRDHILAWNNDSGDDKAYQDTRYFGNLKIVDQRIIKDPRTLAIKGIPNSSLIIDGENTEDYWADIDAVNIDRLVPKLASDYPEATDLAAWYKVFYNSDNLYIYVHVDDDNLVKYAGTSDTYRFDYVEVYVNPNYANDDAKTGAYGDDAMQIRFNLGNPESTSGSGKQPGEGQWDVAFTESATGYTAEIRLAWDGIFVPGITLNPPMEFGFDVVVADNDGQLDGETPQRDMLLSWNNDSKKDNSWNSTQYFGTAALQEMTLTSVTNTVAEVSKDEVTIGFSPAVPNLTKDDMVFLSPSGLKLSLKSVATTDEGASYTIKPSISLVADAEYKFIANAFGYEFDTLVVKLAPVLSTDLERAGISVYPNPVQNTLFVSGQGINEVTITDLSGHLILSKRGTENFNMDVASLRAGIYLISIKRNGQTNVAKFIKQ